MTVRGYKFMLDPPNEIIKDEGGLKDHNAKIEKYSIKPEEGIMVIETNNEKKFYKWHLLDYQEISEEEYNKLFSTVRYERISEIWDFHESNYWIFSCDDGVFTDFYKVDGKKNLDAVVKEILEWL